MFAELTPFLRQHITASIFWQPAEKLYSDQAEHLPFIFWLMETLRPKTVVQVGASYSILYAGYCYAVKNLLLDSRCYVLDFLSGVQETRSQCFAYSDVLPDFCKDEYKSFATLIHSNPDTAQNHFAEGEIDLLHISNCKTSDYVLKTLEQWREKLAKNAVIVIDHLNAVDNGLGLKNIVQQLNKQNQSFSFWHGRGLGIFTHEVNSSSDLSHFFAHISDARIAASLRAFYADLGSRLNKHLKHFEQASDHSATVTALKQEIHLLTHSLSWRITHFLRIFAKKVRTLNRALHPLLIKSQKKNS